MIQAMLQPDFYPHPTSEISLIQTHISWVITTGDFVYKVKKPVDFGFLNFTTLARRKHFCEQELTLNRRLAPDLYLEVLPIGKKDGHYQLSGGDEICDYCLKMVQFRQEDLLDRRLSAGSFDPAWMDVLAADIAQFHSKAEHGVDIARFGAQSFIEAHVYANLEVGRTLAGQAASPETIDALQRFYQGFFASHTGQFAERQEKQHIRACHGDLHLKNITVFRGKPCVFDCIEFNDEFRMIDVMNDVAFLAMDCDARQRPDLGRRFLSRYLEITGDYSGLELLPLYLSYRAGVRGKVACLLSRDPGLNEAAQRQQLTEAQAYFSLAERYANMPKPCLYVIGGLSGSGKSHLALTALAHIPAIIIRSDATRKRLAKKHAGLPLYGQEMNARTYGAMHKAAEIALTAGFPVILDATFLRQEDRQRARSQAESLNLPCHILWLDVDEAQLRHRIRERAAAGVDVSDADLSVLELQLAKYKRPTEADVIFLTSSDHWPF